MSREVIIALDFAEREQAIAFLQPFRGRAPYVKVGMELFYGAGPAIMRELKEMGCRVFLDLKMHDIPHTVGRAARVLAHLSADIINVHAAGTRAMMEAAVEAVTRPDGTRPLVIAVTQLTSTSEKVMQEELGIGGTLEETVLAYAANARKAGLDGVVCSPLESPIIHEHLGASFVTVTPGIRFPEDSPGDQKRIATPADACRLGSDYIVVGRSITAAADPVAAYDRCVREFTAHA